MTINYTHTEPSKSWCRRFHTWCVMANGLGNCSKTACSYGYDRIKANYFGKDADDMAIEALSNNITESSNDVVKSKDDVIEVVLCKDCRYGDALDSFDSGFCGNSNGLQGYITKDDYCSCGERREP